jgi:hypothetical protein
MSARRKYFTINFTHLIYKAVSQSQFMAVLWFLIYGLVQVLFLSLVVYYYCYYHFMQDIYNYIPETNRVSTVYSVAAVLYLQSVLHVLLFHLCNMFCAFTLSLSVVCVQCKTWLFFAFPKFPGFLLCCSDIIWVIFKWFQLPPLLLVSLCIHIPHVLDFYYKVFMF